ncbi:TonB-dependent receptor [Gammaproteobacteria bacterium]|nr:TonB-dependent receptor [Gammaproteobacteria bacterium]
MSSVFLKPLFEKKSDPLSNILKDIFKDNNYALSYLGALTLGLGIAESSHLNADDTIEDIVVTASKRAESLQDVAMSVQAITAAELDQKNIKGLDDIANLSPAVTLDAGGPGNSTFYIRGVSDGGFGNPSGAASTTALYLDDQPLTTIGQTPDLHVFDVERVEILSGPQGTLYGSSSTSGNIKIITKRPDSESIDYGFDVDYGDIKNGSNDESLEAFMNLPLGDNSALRISAYDLTDGGWINNELTSKTFTNSGYTIDNSEYAKDDYNELNKSGHRIRYVSEFLNQSLDLSVLEQSSTFGGSWETDEAVGPRSNSRFNDEYFNDDFSQVSLTLSGDLNDNLEYVYTVSSFDRDVEYTYDYSEYVEYYNYDGPTYTCDYYDYYYYANVSGCQDPRMSYTQTDDHKRDSYEFRVQSKGDSGFQWVLGAFSETSTRDYEIAYMWPGMNPGNLSFQPTNGQWWNLDNTRKEEVDAIFGEGYFNINDDTKLTLGFRSYDQKTMVDAKDGYFGVFDGVDKVFNSSDSGIVPKVNISHDLSEDVMVYGTYSEGFRASGINRVRPAQTAFIPETYESDYLESLEFGVKSVLADGRLILNGALFMMDWSDFQSTTYNLDYSTVAFVDNVGNAEINGLEIDATFKPSDSLTLSAYFVLNDPSLSEDYYDVSGVLQANAGNTLAYVPELSYVLGVDKNFNFFGKPSYISFDFSHTGERYTSQANDLELPSYGIANLRLGVENKNTSVEMYLTNVSDENGYLSRYNDFGDIRRTQNRPRVIGLRFRYRY